MCHEWLDNYNTRGPRRVSPSFVPMIMPNVATGNIGIAFKVHLMHPFLLVQLVTPQSVKRNIKLKLVILMLPLLVVAKLQWFLLLLQVLQMHAHFLLLIQKHRKQQVVHLMMSVMALLWGKVVQF